MTIIDDEQPGYIGFSENSIQVQRQKGKVEVVLVRKKGADGTVKCTMNTMEMKDQLNHAMIDFDFKP